MMHMMIFLLASIPFALSLAIFALVIARRGNWRRFDAADHPQAKPAGLMGATGLPSMKGMASAGISSAGNTAIEPTSLSLM